MTDTDTDMYDNLEPTSGDEKDECDKSPSSSSIKPSSPSASAAGNLSSNSPSISTSNLAQNSAPPSKTGYIAQDTQVRDFSHFQETKSTLFSDPSIIHIGLLYFNFSD